jgi:hypothetical protein
LAKTGNVVVLHPPYPSDLLLCDLGFLDFKLVLKERRQNNIITIHGITIQELLAAFAEFQIQDFQ